MKKKTYKEIFNLIYKDLLKNYQLVDYGLDWLRLRTDNINCNLDFNKNSTFGENFYFGVGGNSYLVVVGSSSMGTTYNFILSYIYKGFEKPLNLFRILKNRLNNNYIIDVYGITFQLYKNYNFDIESFLSFFSSFYEITRVDFNFNFHLDNLKISDYIKTVYQNYNYGIRNNYNNDTITYGLYIKKGRKNGKVIYKLTDRFGFRLYNKIQNIFDLGIAGFYEQYQGLNIIRLEGVLGSDSCKLLNYGNLDYISRQVVEKMIGDSPIILSNNVRSNRKKTSKQLERMRQDIDSRLYTYIMNGGDLNDLDNLKYYIKNYDENDKDYWF